MPARFDAVTRPSPPTDPESRHSIDVGLAVIRADDDGVTLQELVQAARGFHEGAHGLIAASERLFGTARAERVGGVVVVRQVVEEEIEAVAYDHRPTAAA
jgi:hypothetical protein